MCHLMLRHECPDDDHVHRHDDDTHDDHDCPCMKIDLYKLCTLGLILCAGDSHLKARVLYTLAQRVMQTHIGAEDEEFTEIFGWIV